MKKQLLTAAIVIGLGSATSTVSGAAPSAPNAEIAYKIVKKFKGSAGAQAFFQGLGAAVGGTLATGFLGPFGPFLGAGVGAY